MTGTETSLSSRDSPLVLVFRHTVMGTGGKVLGEKKKSFYLKSYFSPKTFIPLLFPLR